MPDVDSLRQQLRDRGYLSHGIERWFALDPWSSRAFWLELVTVALKGGTLIALFAALPLAAIMLFRNHPLGASETLLMTLLYGAASLAVAFAFLVVIAMFLRLRPQLAVDTPRALLAISFFAAAALTAPIVIWWYGFDAPPSMPELFTGLVLIVVFFLIATIVVSAALLSFSIYELQRVPAIHQKPRGVPMTMAASILIALLFIPAYASQDRQHAAAPLQVVTTPTKARIALIAVDGLTYEILTRTRPDLVATFATVMKLGPMPGDSTTERWASVGTGVPTSLHGVRAIEGLRFRGRAHLIQTISTADVVLRDVGPLVGLVRREPLPPSVRKRDYVWEIAGGRGTRALSVNWWTTGDTRNGVLTSIGQASIFASTAFRKASPASTAMSVDDAASRSFDRELEQEPQSLATVYLPALDVVLNRLALDPSTQVSASVNILAQLASTIERTRKRGYEVIMVGLPGDHQTGAGVLASTIAMTPASSSPFNIAPTVLQLLGFPPSSEMPGTPLGGTPQPRIATYGTRGSAAQNVKVNDEYYQNLKSLGYIR